MLKTIYSFDAGPRAKECAQAIAVLIFNADEDGKDIVDAGVRYKKNNTVNIVIEPEDDSPENRKDLFTALAEVSTWVLDAAKKGFDGNSPEEMLEIFAYPDEGTSFYSNVRGKTDLQISDIEKVVEEIKKANGQMSLGEALDVIKSAGMGIKK